MSGLDCDILVVGAGPAGSALAASLARAGRDVRLIEAASHPRPKACAEYASPRIREELGLIGLAEADWRADAHPIRGMRVVRGTDAVDVRYRDEAGPRQAWGVDRLRFDAGLAAHAVASGARLSERTALRDLRFGTDGRASVLLQGPGGRERISARWVVGADGARSRVARLVGVERPVRLPRRLGLVAHLEGGAELADSGEMHVGQGAYVGLAPLAGGRLNVGMALPLGGRGSAERRFADTIASLPAVAARLAGRGRLTPIRGSAPIGHRVARAAGPGWMLVGDAAGFIDPFSGEGIYRALRSARAAATAIGGGDAGAEARYLAERRRAFAAKDTLTWVVQAMLAAPPLLGYALRRLDRRPALADRFGSTLGDCRPATDALSPAFVVQVLRP